jgi:hypothetical protein
MRAAADQEEAERPTDPYEVEPVDEAEKTRLGRYLRPGAAPLSQFGVRWLRRAVSCH